MQHFGANESSGFDQQLHHPKIYEKNGGECMDLPGPVFVDPPPSYHTLVEAVADRLDDPRSPLSRAFAMQQILPYAMPRLLSTSFDTTRRGCNVGNNQETGLRTRNILNVRTSAWGQVQTFGELADTDPELGWAMASTLGDVQEVMRDALRPAVQSGAVAIRDAGNWGGAIGEPYPPRIPFGLNRLSAAPYIAMASLSNVGDQFMDTTPVWVKDDAMMTGPQFRGEDPPQFGEPELGNSNLGEPEFAAMPTYVSADHAVALHTELTYWDHPTRRVVDISTANQPRIKFMGNMAIKVLR